MIPEARGALAIEATLLAPCCYNGTLDTHESELARTLRAEIEGRVSQGETAETIRADMVERYGAKVVAMPSEHHFGAVLSIAGVVAALIIGFSFFRIRRWLVKPKGAPKASNVATDDKKNDAYDQRINDELESLE